MMEVKRIQAMIGADADTLYRISHPDFIYTHTLGDRECLNQFVQCLTSRYYQYHWVEMSEEKIVIAGETGLAYGRMVSRVAVMGMDRQLDNRMLSVWTRQDGRWLWLAYQPTPVRTR